MIRYWFYSPSIGRISVYTLRLILSIHGATKNAEPCKANRIVMKMLELTFQAPSQNLACEEALLDRCEAGDLQSVLRFWESNSHFVVLGHSNKINSEVDPSACANRGIPILRRISGGGTVLQGPGCFNYALLLPLEEHGPTRSIESTNAYVLGRHRDALRRRLGDSVEIQGVSDLTWKGRKFSGNAQRRKKRYVLFHGTFLTGFDLSLISELLPMPSRQPDYRANRSHSDFIVNLPLTSSEIKELLIDAWAAINPLMEIPHDRIVTLTQERYDCQEWTRKF